MRTGEDERVSGAVNTASGMAKPLSILSIFKSASAYVSVTFFGSIFLRSLITTPVGQLG